MTLKAPLLSARQQFLLLQKRDKNVQSLAPHERKIFESICELNDSSTRMNKTSNELNAMLKSPTARDRFNNLHEQSRYQKSNTMIANLRPAEVKSAARQVLRGFIRDVRKIAAMNLDF